MRRRRRVGGGGHMKLEGLGNVGMDLGGFGGKD